MIFFVLSGYVLASSLAGSNFSLESIGRFYARRFFRIYPAIFAVSVLSAVYLLVLHSQIPTPGASHWYRSAYRAGFPSPEGFALSLAGWRNELIPPLWTVRIEIFGSLAMPALAYLVKANLGLPLIAATTALSFAAPASNWTHLVCFALGGYAAHLAPRFKCRANIAVLICSALFMYFIRLIEPAWQFEANDGALIPTVIESVSAAFVVVNIAALDISFLRSKQLIWLGDISYSVYLVHFVILSCWAKLIGHTPFEAEIKVPLLMIATLLTTLPIAHYCYRFIELPGIALGKEVLKRMSGKSVADGALARQEP